MDTFLVNLENRRKDNIKAFWWFFPQIDFLQLYEIHRYSSAFLGYQGALVGSTSQRENWEKGISYKNHITTI